MDQPIIRLGTSAFTAAGWEGSFYPEGMKPADFLSYYATHFNSVELDNTFYRAPSKTTVEGWARKTPEGFMFAAKVPQAITHEKVLVDCDAEFEQFVETMELLGKKLGPLLFQFGYFNKNAFAGLQKRLDTGLRLSVLHVTAILGHANLRFRDFLVGAGAGIRTLDHRFKRPLL